MLGVVEVNVLITVMSTNKYYTSVNNTTFILYAMVIYTIAYKIKGDMFRPSRSSSDPPRKQIQELLVFPHCGIPNAHTIQLQK